tara:strand:- start:747 stop:1040 length:294 start_codon:yes stop_codon:yes gene_type:complete
MTNIEKLEHLNQIVGQEINARDNLVFELYKKNDIFELSARETKNRDFDRFNGVPLEDEKEELLTQISDTTSWIRKQKELIEIQKTVVEFEGYALVRK